MDRRERWAEPVEALRAALDGRQAEMWTALPGIVQSFDPAAMTVSVQPAVAGRISDEAGKAASVDLPILPDVPVVFPGGGGFALTFPVAAGDECLVVFASRCIDAWWQSGGVGEPMEPRMHDLSDGFALVGV
ncbi:Gp138 family membrane-puncturing spike protein, partial [Bilophila wadsworthia]